MESLIKENERLDDLQLKDLKLIQNPRGFCFGVDAVLLSHFAKSEIKKGSNVLDLCTGNGIIPVLLWAKTEAKKITGVEIQEEVAEMAQRSIIFNNLTEKVEIICEDLKKSPETFGKCSFDYITCNPPYKEDHGGLKNTEDTVTIARHEIKCKLEDIIKASEALLKPAGKLALIHRPERLIDIIYLMKSYRIEPKRLQFIHPSAEKTATMILIEGTKHGKPKLKLLPPLYVHKENGEYTEEINKIYERGTQ